MMFIVPKCTWLLEVKLIILLKLSMNIFYLGIHWIPDIISYQQVYFFLLKFNYLRITIILTLKSMETDKRSNTEHHVT